MLRNDLPLSFSDHGDELVIHVGGEIDHHSAAPVRSAVDEKILALRPRRVLLELSSVEFMDSSGLGLIMGRLALCKQVGSAFAVLDPAPPVQKIMHLAGLERMVTILRTKKPV